MECIWMFPDSPRRKINTFFKQFSKLSAWIYKCSKGLLDLCSCREAIPCICMPITNKFPITPCRSRPLSARRPNILDALQATEGSERGQLSLNSWCRWLILVLQQFLEHSTLRHRGVTSIKVTVHWRNNSVLWCYNGQSVIKNKFLQLYDVRNTNRFSN